MRTDTKPNSTNAADRPEVRPRATATRSRPLGHDLPRVPRRYGQWTAAVLFVLFAVLAAGWLWQQKSDRLEILAIVRPVPVGAVISAEDLSVVEVAGVEDGVPASESASIIGKAAVVGLVDGQILTPDMVTTDPLPGPGERIVGVELDPTRAPGGLIPGDAVSVLAVPPSGDPSTPQELDDPIVLADHATVASVEQVEGAGPRMTLLVRQEVADRVTAYAAAGRIALVQAPLGGDD